MKPNQDDDEGWGGILNTMKKNMQKSVDAINRVIVKRFATLNQDITDVKSKNSSIAEKLDDVQNSIQKQDLSVTAQIKDVQ